MNSNPPNQARAIALYRDHARGYDASAERTMRFRQRTIAKLALKPGDRVLDVACGTGLSFPMLREGVGEQGEVIGIDISPEMLEHARHRVSEAGWNNVSVIESPLESAELPGQFDAILFNFTHDIVRSPPAVERIFSASTPGARIAIAGMKYFPWWLSPANILVRRMARPYMTTFDGLEKPWELLLPYLSDFSYQSELYGMAYLGWGQVVEHGHEHSDRSAAMDMS